MRRPRGRYESRKLTSAKFMRTNSTLTMNWTVSDTIAAAMQIWPFISLFGGHHHYFLQSKYRSRMNVEPDLRVCLLEMAPKNR